MESKTLHDVLFTILVASFFSEAFFIEPVIITQFRSTFWKNSSVFTFFQKPFLTRPFQLPPNSDIFQEKHKFAIASFQSCLIYTLVERKSLVSVLGPSRRSTLSFHFFWQICEFNWQCCVRKDKFKTVLIQSLFCQKERVWTSQSVCVFL